MQMPSPIATTERLITAALNWIWWKSRQWHKIDG